MVHKRQLGVGGGEGSELPNKHRRLFSTLFKGANNVRSLEEILPNLEPMIRKWVREEMDSSINRLQRYPSNQLECSGSRTLQLQFQSNLPDTLFTGSKVVSDYKSPIKVVLYDSNTGKIVTSGPLSLIKVTITVLDADFGSDDRDDWTKKDFDHKIVQNREGKRPLVTGDLTVMLQNGEGYIGEFIFTDNSSWIRSGKFRLGAKAHSRSDERSIREGMSNAFKVKDHRGESYQKHYPPYLDDEVWRLEKIAKDGASHKKLTQLGVSTVRDFLRLFMIDRVSLRTMIPTTSNKAWEKIIEHATTCVIDDTKYMYRTTQGSNLFFNSIYKVVGVSFDGENCVSVDNLNLYQKNLVDELKRIAYKSVEDWVSVCEPSIIDYPMLLPCPPLAENFPEQDEQLEMPIIVDRPSISPPYNCEVEQDNSGSFEIGKSLHQLQGFNPTFRDSFGIFNSPWASQLYNTDDIPIDDNFQVESSLWQGNNALYHLDSSCRDFSSNYGIRINTRNGKPKTRWFKVLAPVKWLVRVRRNVAARESKTFHNYM